jgi:hypothetical protein
LTPKKQAMGSNESQANEATHGCIVSDQGRRKGKEEEAKKKKLTMS